MSEIRWGKEGQLPACSMLVSVSGITDTYAEKYIYNCAYSMRKAKAMYPGVV